MTSQPTKILTIHQVRTGDTISLPQRPETYSDNRPRTYSPDEQLKVTCAWWHRDTARHMIQLDPQHSNAIIAFDDQTTLVTLHHRPSAGPIDARYQVGHKVRVYWMDKLHSGIVIEIAEAADDVVYTVRTERGTPAYVGPENMKLDRSPLPAEGQQWVCLHGRHEGLVLTVVEPDGLEARCQREDGSTDTYILTSEHYGVTVDTAPIPTGTPGTDYTEIEMMVAGTTRMVRVFH